jgi:hypothetical protein
MILKGNVLYELDKIRDKESGCFLARWRTKVEQQRQMSQI